MNLFLGLLAFIVLLVLAAIAWLMIDFLRWSRRGPFDDQHTLPGRRKDDA